MFVTAVCSLVWAPLLIRALGVELYGLFLAFVAVAALGGLGDLGMSGAVGIRVVQMLARGEADACRRFLAHARGLFLILSLTLAGGFIALAPWLPEILRFAPLPGAGSLPALFVVGGVAVGLTIINGYFQTVNYAHGNVVWPILPGLLLVQAGFLGQWLLARAGAPLWIQYTPYLATALLTIVLAVWMLRTSHPWLGEIRPAAPTGAESRALATASFWTYLVMLGHQLYVTTDRLVLNAGFGAQFVPAYRFNYRLPELAIGVLISATFVSMPAIVSRLLSADVEQRAFGISGAQRLHCFLTLGACAAAAGYLGINDWFMRLWLGPEFVVPLAWQAAFAAHLAVAASGDTFVQLAGRLEARGLRLAGLTFASTGVLNFLLSCLSMRLGSILGMALATLVAQSIVSAVMSRRACALLHISWPRALARTFLLPLVFVALAAGLRAVVPMHSAAGVASFTAAAALLLAGCAALLGVSLQMLVDEWKRLRATFA